MSITEPSAVERFLYVATGKLFGRLFYRPYFDSLDLDGIGRILDFGAGPGFGAACLARRLESTGGTVVAFDISEIWQRTAKKRLKHFTNIEYVCADITDETLDPGPVDAAVAHFVIHDIPPPARQAVVNELSRLLKPGGTLFVREPSDTSHGMPPDELRAMTASAGLEVREFTVLKTLGKRTSYAMVFKNPG